MTSHHLTPHLSFETVPSATLSARQYDTILALCSRAYQKPFAPYLEPHDAPTHLLGFVEERLVCHALWVERWFQLDDGPLLRTAYVEAVATEPADHGRGFATALMRYLIANLDGFELAALGPSDPAFYTRLGWQSWRGPLSVRNNGTTMPTPNGRVMVHALPTSPLLKLDAPLSAEWRQGALW